MGFNVSCTKQYSSTHCQCFHLFQYEQCEKFLKINRNNLEDALGDLLTINALPQDDPMATFGSSPLIARKHPTSLNGAHLKQTYSPSSSGSMNSAVSSATTPHTFPGLNDQQAVTHQLSMSGQVTPGVQPQMNHMAHHPKHLQQDISQKLARLQHMKQSLAMQLSQLKSSQPHQANQPQLLSLQLNQVNANISSLNQQLLLVSQSSQQSQYKGASRNGGKPADFKSVNGMQNSTSGYNGHSDQLGYQSSQGGAEMNGLSYNMHKMSVGSSQPSYSQQSAQSMSRLQQIISGPADSVDRDGNRGLDELSRQSYRSSIMQPTSEQPSCFSRSMSADPSITTSSSSSSFAGKGNMVDDIPEFKPGVPWQPRSHTKEPPQTFSNSLGFNPTSSSSYLSSSDSKYATSSENDGYYQASHDSSYRSSFTTGNHQMGGGSFDSQQQYGGSGYSTSKGVHRDRISAQRGGRNGRGNYTHSGQSSGGQFGMLQSPQQRGHYVGRGQQSSQSSQSHYTGSSTAVNSYSGPPQGFNQPRIPRGFDSPSSTKKWNSDSSNPWSNKPFSGMC